MKRITLGILAHVDAGKTTLSEAMLYTCGAISERGRVDKRTSALDTHSEERERGITIFSGLASFEYEDTAFTILDTPGHIDFFPECERALSVQDYAVLVVSATEGAHPHTVTLFNMLRERHIPTFIFVNKTDLSDRRRVDILAELRCVLTPGACDFNLLSEDQDRFYEECAGTDERLMQNYFSGENISYSMLSEAIKRLNLTPVVFGSALKNTGVDVLLRVLSSFTEAKCYSKSLLGAKIFKVMTAPDGARLAYMKLTGGEIKIKDSLSINAGGEKISFKVEQIRAYSADKYKSLRSAEAGMIVAIPGVPGAVPGMGLGTAAREVSSIRPVLDYRMSFPCGTDIYSAYLKLVPLSEEEPTLALRYDSEKREISVRLMGEIQIEVLTKILKERFGLDVKFEPAGVLYLETIVDTVYGAGHFEPLMHYAEVRLRIDPLPRGSGLVFASEVPTDMLKLNWQRLIISHLEERRHTGKLIGAPITDMKITLVGGRAHPKHTDGGDFRQATFRALNQGLMKARESLQLLEPTFNFEITLPEGNISRLIYDIDKMGGEYEAPLFLEGVATLRGFAPVAGLQSYATVLRAYSGGAGKILLMPGDYIPCTNADEVIREAGYDPEADERANPSSVFCKGGAGYTVPWYLADELMHTDSPEAKNTLSGGAEAEAPRIQKSTYRGTAEEDRELMRIFESNYGKIKPRVAAQRRETAAAAPAERRRQRIQRQGVEYLIIDGYNLIHSMPKLSAIAKAELAHARDMLISMLCNFSGFRKCKIIVVFDAYKRQGGEGSSEDFGNVTVIYTKERQTADAYIERATYKITAPDRVRVVTGDYSEQLVVLGNGGIRVTPAEFCRELALVEEELSDYI